MKKIISLTNVFIKEYYQNLPVFDTSNKKFNKKSIFFWLVIIIFFGVAYLSYEIIKFLVDIGQKKIFINLYLPILILFLMFEAILSFANIFFFSKETENVLHMPIKPIELIVSKLSTLLCMLYASEGILAVVPLALYGMMSGLNFVYFIWGIATLLLYPIFVSGLVGIAIFILMRFSKFIRNKEVFQILLVIFIMIITFAVEYIITSQLFNIQSNEQALGQMINLEDRLNNINKLFLIVNPTIKMLTNPATLHAIVYFGSVLLICSLEMLVFILIGNHSYIKDILKNTLSKGKAIKNNKKINIKKKIKTKGIAKTYIIKELKLLVLL